MDRSVAAFTDVAEAPPLKGQTRAFFSGWTTVLPPELVALVQKFASLFQQKMNALRFRLRRWSHGPVFPFAKLVVALERTTRFVQGSLTSSFDGSFLVLLVQTIRARQVGVEIEALLGDELFDALDRLVSQLAQFHQIVLARRVSGVSQPFSNIIQSLQQMSLVDVPKVTKLAFDSSAGAFNRGRQPLFLCVFLLFPAFFVVGSTMHKQDCQDDRGDYQDAAAYDDSN